MVEVAYQVRDQADVLVGSQETEPGAGWPYDTVVGEPVANPMMDGAALASQIVDCFAESYGTSDSVTQSAIDTSHIAELAQALSDLAEYVSDHKDACYLIMGRAIRAAQTFSDPDYKDAYDLCRVIAERSAEVPDLAKRAQAVMALIDPPGVDRLVIHERHHGPRMNNVHGLSVYIPSRNLSPFYGRLAFASETLWDDMLTELITR